MLLNLHVKNFALIEEADLELGEGLNIFTGETGAGKSILIDAVSAALGGRTRSDVIRKGADFAYVELMFSVGEEKKQALEALDVSTEYDCILVSRKILPGRSIHKINDETVTSAKVRRATELLLDIHGQHEHQSLLHRKKHLEILDQYADSEISGLRQRVETLFSEYQSLKEESEALNVNPEDRRREMDFLSYEIAEIEEAQVREGEIEELEATYRRAANSQKIAERVSRTLGELEEGSSGAAEALSRAQRELGSAAELDESLISASETLAAAEDLVSGLCRELRDYGESLQYDPQELRRIEERLDLLHRLESKYGDGVPAILDALAGRQEKLAEWERFEERRKETEERLAALTGELAEACEDLSRCRREASEGLAQAIREALLDLNFLNVDFQIQFERLPEFSRLGTDAVEFLISTNPGEPPRPLGQVASGGELSRIMLAIKAVLSERDQIPTLIFDEIDTGISGRTAQKVSEKLHWIARRHQVICVTHLPQIAAMADRHFCIEKDAAAAGTQTRIRTLSDAESVEELARLLGGAEITEAVYQNAHEMKELAGRTRLSL